VLASVGLLMLVYPLTQGRENGWPAWGFVSMALSVVVLALFVRYEKYKSAKDNSPLLELSLFRVKSFFVGVGVQLTYGVVSGIFFLVWSLYMQLGLGWGPLKAGLTGIPFSVAGAVTSGLSVAVLVPRFGNRVLQLGAVVKIIGALTFIWAVHTYGTGIGPWQMALPLLIMGAGLGFIVAPITDAVLAEVPEEHAGSASGVINTTNQLGLAVGLALCSVVFFDVVDDTVPGTAAQVFSDGFSNAMWYVVAGLVVVLALIFALPRSARMKGDTVAPSEAEAKPVPVT